MQMSRIYYEGEGPEKVLRFDPILTIIRTIQGQPGLWRSVPSKELPGSASAVYQRNSGPIEVRPKRIRNAL